MEKGLLEKTGKSLEYWIKVVKTTGLEKHSEIIKHLKTEHSFTHGFANFVSLKSRAADAASMDSDELVDQQYSKGREQLKPIYDHLLARVRTLGADIEIVPKKANVSVRRKRQFLLIQPSTKTRLDLGLKFNNAIITDRLQDSGRFGAMCTNRIEVFSKEDIDEELLSYVEQAYQEAG